MEGSLGKDVLKGGGGDDDMYGDPGDDNLKGGSGDDYLNGEEGKDKHFGGPGNDYIDMLDDDNGKVDRAVCGSGNDTVIIGPGDIFSDDCETVVAPRRNRG